MGDDDDVAGVMKGKFYRQLDETVGNKKGDNNFYLSKERYAALVTEVKEAKTVRTKRTVHYRRLRRYDVLKIGGGEKLISPVSADKEEIVYYAVYDDLFDIIREAHLSVGHGGRTRTAKELARKYRNVTTEAIVTFLRLCETCQKKLQLKTRKVVVKPILQREMNSRCQVDLIDMQSKPDGDMRFIMVYQDHLTKFVILRALPNKTAEEVAKQLLDIFTLFGAPNILQSDNGREFCNETVENLCRLWDGVKVVHGKPRHSQSQGSVERANQDVENMLSSWMETNGTTKWSEGIRFVQAMKNRAHHEGIECSPYEAMFGAPMKMGVASLAGLRGVFGDVCSEEDLESALNLNSGSEDSTETTTSGDDDEGGVSEDSPPPSPMDVVEEEEEEEEENLPSCSAESTAVTRKTKGREHYRKCAREGLEKQAKRMKEASRKKCERPTVGDNVAVKIPDVDRAKMDPKALIAVVVSVKDEEFYELGTKYGKLNALYTINQFNPCKETFLRTEEVPPGTVSLRFVVKKLSLVGGQGFKRCDCRQKCVTNRCRCRSSKLLCNSRCHNSQPCNNK